MENLPVPIFHAKKIWAIQLSNTNHRIWENKEIESKLFFQWDDISVPNSATYNDISIAVAQKYSNDRIEKVKSIAYGIYQYPKLQKGDGILGVDGERLVKKTGVVISKSIKTKQNRKVEIDIRWIKEIREGNADLDIFNTELEIQSVNQSMLKNISLPFVIEGGGSNVAKGASSLGENNPYIKLVPMSEPKFKSEKEDKGGKIKLFYGTNRNKLYTNDMNKFYGDDLSELKFGMCEVSIPRGHIQGEIERPLSIWVFKFSEKERKHVILDEINELEEQQFFSQLTNDIKKHSTKSSLIFIHGYKTNFDEAARRTAQIAWDIPFDGIAGFYSWPSCGRTLSYLKDIEQVDATIPFFEEFIEKFVLKTNIEKLHLIAHSMGNRLLTFTLNNLSAKTDFSQKLNIIQQIVLAAPDIDQSVFKSIILPKFQNVGSRRTLYSSDKDKALHLSEELRRGLSRLGDAGSSLFVDSSLDTIDASNVKSDGNNHSYIFDTKELLSDLHYLLNLGLDPLNRRLRARKKNSLKYWLFPK